MDVILTVHIGRDVHSESVCFCRASVGMSRTDKKYTECLSEWDRLAEYLNARCPQCELIAPVKPVVPENSTPPKQAWPGATDSLRAIGVKETPAEAMQLSGLDEFIEKVSKFIGSGTAVRSIAFLGNRGIGRNSVLGMLFKRMEDQYNNGRLCWFNVRQLPTDVSGESLTILMGQTLVKLLSGSGAAAKQAGNILSGLAGLTTGIIVGDTSLSKDVAGDVLCKNGTDIQAESATTLFGRIEKKARSKSGKVIFFLDGLEQLAPARAVEMLEAVQGYLDCKGCMFVISADPVAILRGARDRYDRDKAERFFDRIFETTVKVPTSGFHTEGYVKEKLEKMGIQAEDGAELDLYSALIQHSIGRDTEIMDRLFTSAQLLKDLSGEAVYADRYKRQMLFALLCMQMQFRDVYDYAMQQRDSVTPELLASLCGKSAQPWMAAQKEDEMAAYQDFSGVLAQIISPEISEAECRAFAEMLELSNVTSR